MIKKVNEADAQALHGQYRSNDLFLQWSPVLARLERAEGGLDAVSYWFLAGQKLSGLRRIQAHREEEIPHLYNGLLREFREIDMDGVMKMTSSPAQCRLFAGAVMGIIYTSLMNAVEKGHEEEEFGNAPICVAILDTMQDNSFFAALLNKFFGRKKWFDGKEVVISSYDPMTLTPSLDDLTGDSKEEAKAMYQHLIELTQGIKMVIGSGQWPHWEKLCKQISLDVELRVRLKSVEPRNNEWGMNQKMVCNVLGLFLTEKQLHNVISRINNAISSKNLRTYIRNHQAFNESACALTREQHECIKQMLLDLSQPS
ncbi:MAG: hypothetical protein IJ142_00865 [Bacteroidaceae bacterium]|nr:hypothetical protein [Bacteroidaceae bacterium]